MKTIGKILLLMGCLLLGVLPAWACSSMGPSRGNYEVRGEQVYYRPYGKSFDQNSYAIVDGADAETLSYLDEEELPSSYSDGTKLYFSDYALDKNHVYYQGQVLKEIDPAQVVLLEQRFGQIVLSDGVNQYVSREDMRKWDGYLKDKEHVYYYGRLLAGGNGDNFEWLPFHNKHFYQYGHDYARDNQHIYLYGEKVLGDPQTASEIGYGYYSDAKHIYFRGEILDGALPDAFEPKGVFIISNGHVYYRAQQLALDAASFQILEHMHNSPILACEGTTYAGSFIKDQHGVYILYASGTLKRLDNADVDSFKVYPSTGWAVDKSQVYRYGRDWRSDGEIEIAVLKLDPQKVYQEDIKLEDRDVMKLYRDGHAIYLYSKSFEEAKNFEPLLGGDAKTFESYAALWKGIIFRDKTGLYFAQITTYSREPELVKILNGEAKLVCLENKYACVLSKNTLYYVFDDGTVEQAKIGNEKDLRCLQSGKLLPTSLDMTASEGMCFDRNYFYNRGERKAMYYGGYEDALSHVVDSIELEEKRIESLKRVNIQIKPLIINERQESADFHRIHYL